MIGGQDIVVQKEVSSDDVNFIVDSIRLKWPDLYIEGNIELDFPFNIFLYRNKEAFESWEEFGLVDENNKDMIFITFESDLISFVIFEHEALTKMVNGLVLSLSDE